MQDQVYEVTIRGIRPFIMHNGRLCDPLDPFTKVLKVLAKAKEIRRYRFLPGRWAYTIA